MKRRILIAALLLLPHFAIQAAQAYTCDNTVDSIALNQSGLVTVTMGAFNSVYVCSLTSAYNGMSPESCKHTYALLMAASLSKRKVQYAFNDNMTCTTHPAWSMLTGNYYGPVLLP